MILRFTIFSFAFCSTVLIYLQIAPVAIDIFTRPLSRKVGEAEKQLEAMFVHIEKGKLLLIYALLPFAVGIASFVIFRKVIFLLIGVIVGFLIPAMIIKRLQALRKARFKSQLIDAILILSSSLKGGLSLLQAVEVLVEEMPAPISQEFGLVVRENRMGITLDESLKRLNERIHIEELGLLINSILVAKETGGDLTKVLSRLSITIRDNFKLQENIKTLTLQGRMQGMIMSVLPFIFIAGVLTTNKHHFDIMFQSETGRMLMIVGTILLVAGVILVRKFSKINI